MNTVANQKKDWEKDYSENKVIDCPWCEHDRPDHSCRNCYSSMTQESCWRYYGHCSYECLKYIRDALPNDQKEKANAGISCRCDDPRCAKCLSVNCKDENCPTHNQNLKLGFQKEVINKHDEIKK